MTFHNEEEKNALISSLTTPPVIGSVFGSPSSGRAPGLPASGSKSPLSSSLAPKKVKSIRDLRPGQISRIIGKVLGGFKSGGTKKGEISFRQEREGS